MQITVTNQKTKSIRSPSFEADFGSQGTKKATANATAAAASPTATRRTSTPLRTVASLLNPGARRLLRTSVTNLYEACFRRGGPGYTAPVGPQKAPERRTNGNRSEPATDRRRSRPRLGINGDIGSVNEDAIGWILMIVGAVGLVLSMIFWSSWAGPGYWSRRRGYADEAAPPPGPGY